jgi:hypothetical protein
MFIIALASTTTKSFNLVATALKSASLTRKAIDWWVGASYYALNR